MAITCRNRRIAGDAQAAFQSGQPQFRQLNPAALWANEPLRDEDVKWRWWPYVGPVNSFGLAIRYISLPLWASIFDTFMMLNMLTTFITTSRKLATESWLRQVRSLISISGTPECK